MLLFINTNSLQLENQVNLKTNKERKKHTIHLFFLYERFLIKI
jgi:hypothetical protein